MKSYSFDDIKFVKHVGDVNPCSVEDAAFKINGNEVGLDSLHNSIGGNIMKAIEESKELKIDSMGKVVK